MSERHNMSDIDLMCLRDGELSEAEASGFGALAADDEVKLLALDQIGDAVQTYLELESDAADDRLAGMWGNIERRIHANGKSPDEASASDPASSPREVGRAETRGLGAWLTEWFERYRGHFVTGAVSAAAVAVVLLMVVPRNQVEIVEVPAPATDAPVAPVVDPESQPPEIENLEVYEGSGMILTLPGEEGESSASVIWLSLEDEDTMEGPI